MNFEQLIELLKFICKNNGWGTDSFYPNACERHRECFKYVDFTIDTRDEKIFWIVFRDGSGPTHEKKFRVESEEELKKLYEFLDKSTKKEK